MRLYLVRHGQASSEEEDPQRGLSNEGAGEVRKVAGFIERLGLGVRAVWNSGKRRAEQTAETLASALGGNVKTVARAGLAPNDLTREVMEELASADEDLMIVGHLPFLDKLAWGLLAGGEGAEVFSFRSGGILCLDRGEQSTWQVGWMVVPEILCEVRDG